MYVNYVTSLLAINRTIINTFPQQNTEKYYLETKKYSHLICSFCNKKYKSRAGLWKHKKSCKFKGQSQPNTVPDFGDDETENLGKNDNIKESTDSDIFKNIEKENNELRNMIKTLCNQNTSLMTRMSEQNQTIKDMVPKIGNQINTTHQNLNIQIFLNEQCKDALNIMDFVNSLHLQLEDLENTGKLGLVEGTTKIFLDGLKQLDLYKRPIHCTDLKKETVYVRDNDQWEKDVKCDKMKKAISSINDMNLKQAAEWIDENPEKYDDYLNIMNNVTKSDISKESEQIIKNVSKEIMVPPPEK